MATTISTDKSRQLDWIIRKSTDQSITIQFNTTGGPAFDLSAYVLVLEVFKHSSSTPILTLSQGSGITNGGPTGTAVVSLTETTSDILEGRYWYRLHYTAPTNGVLLTGKFQVNDGVFDDTFSTQQTFTISLGTTEVILDVSLAGGGGGSGDMILASAQTVTGAKTFNNGTLLMRNVANTFSSQFTNSNTAARTYTLPDASGTVALRSDLSGWLTGSLTANATINTNGNVLTVDDNGGFTINIINDGFFENGLFTLNNVSSSQTVLFGNTNSGLYYGADYSADYTSRSLVDKGYVDTQVAVGNWRLASGGALTGANTISGSFNIGFTNTAIGIGVAPASITANTRLDIRGPGSTSSTFSLRVANSANVITLHSRDDGALFQGPNGNNIYFDGTTAGLWRPVSNSFLRIANDGTVGAQFLFYGSTHPTLPNRLEAYSTALFHFVNPPAVFIGGVSGVTKGANTGDRVLMINNANTNPTAAQTDAIIISSRDSSDCSANATLSLFLEQAPEATATFTQSHRLKVWINNTEYWLPLDNV